MDLSVGRPKPGGWRQIKRALQSSIVRQLLDLPDSDALLEIIGPDGLIQLKAEADEIVTGRIRLFGGQPVPLNLIPSGELQHWTKSQHDGDIKFIWEPARFGWAFALGRAYYLTGDERYPAAFWRYFETFQQANPLNLGPNWESSPRSRPAPDRFHFRCPNLCRFCEIHCTSHLAPYTGHR